jgi:Protein chain release factor A
MLENISLIEQRNTDLAAQMLAAEGDYRQLHTLNQEQTRLKPIVDAAERYRKLREELVACQAAAQDAKFDTSQNVEYAMLLETEIRDLTTQIEQAEADLKKLLLPRDPRDEKNVILEIRAGAGGDEAALFAQDLLRMYFRYAERQGWHSEILNLEENSPKGIKEASVKLVAPGAYSKLKFESGVHRVQRVPATETQERVQTSTATVAVLAEVDEIEITILDTDLEWDIYRSSCAGGQNMQKNSTAVRLTHKPTGLVVTCQDERSQLRNRLRAISVLRARLYDLQINERREGLAHERQEQIGTGARAEKIRTYNYPQNRVTDHRIDFSMHNLPDVMDGHLDPLIEQLALADETRRLATGEVAGR